MKSLLTKMLKALALSLVIMLWAPTVFSDVTCIDTCSAQLAQCTNSGAGSANCEDQYDACVERCIGLQE
jgi:hypothetical protein